MNDRKEYGFTNAGTDGIVPVQVEKKEPTILAEEAHKEQEPVLQKQESFVVESVIPVEKKKRGRPAKTVTTVVTETVPVEPIKEIKSEKEWYCSTCRETIGDKNVMRIGAGDNGRCAVFCPQCCKSLGFLDPVVLETVARLIKDNPTGK